MRMTPKEWNAKKQMVVLLMEKGYSRGKIREDLKIGTTTLQKMLKEAGLEK